MIVIQVLGVPDASTEDELQAITKDLHDLCQAAGDRGCYVRFSADRMKWGLGDEIVALISGISVGDTHTMSPDYFADRVGEVLEKHFPDALIGHQILQAVTTRELRKRS